jgi:hypothetical protein
MVVLITTIFKQSMRHLLGDHFTGVSSQVWRNWKMEFFNLMTGQLFHSNDSDLTANLPPHLVRAEYTFHTPMPPSRQRHGNQVPVLLEREVQIYGHHRGLIIVLDDLDQRFAMTNRFSSWSFM